MAQPSQPSGRLNGPEDYPYDASLRAEKLHGLDRLRGIADRKLAGYLYVLYARADENASQDAERRTEHPLRLEALRRVAVRALDGEFGTDARELAAYLLLDEAGRQRLDAAPLRAFADRFRELRRERL